MTISIPGVILKEITPEELEESATLVPGAADIWREIARRVNLYPICQVSSDIGETVVRGALEHAGLLGTQLGQVKEHRALFCETLIGKVSMVRQLEADIHIDGRPSTVSDLQRFVQQLVLVEAPGQEKPAGSSSGPLAANNIQHAPSLAAALGLPSTF